MKFLLPLSALVFGCFTLVADVPPQSVAQPAVVKLQAAEQAKPESAGDSQMQAKPEPATDSQAQPQAAAQQSQGAKAVAQPVTQQQPFMGLVWGMDQDEVEAVLAKDDNLLAHGTHLILQAGRTDYYARRYGTYILLGVPMDLVCGFDRDYTSLELIVLRYSTGNFNRALEAYDKLTTYFSVLFLGVDTGRNLRDRERSVSRQDIEMNWDFPPTRFNMRVWGSGARGELSIWLSKIGQ